MNGARPAAAAGSMHVKEDRTIALAEMRTVDPHQGTADLVENPGRDVSRNDRIRHARQSAVPEVHVGAAHFGAYCSEQRGSVRQIGSIEFADLEGCRGPGMTAARMRSLTAYVTLYRPGSIDASPSEA